jgi:carboxyl-terminal processing protease
MDRILKVVIACLGVAIIGLASYTFGYRNGSGRQVPLRIDTSQPGAGLAIIRDAYDEIRGKAVKQPTEDALARGAIRGMIKVLQNAQDDPYALFFSPDEYESFSELTTGKFSGIGVWLKPDAKEMQIVSVLPSTPAAAAGLQEGDIIRTVDGQAVIDMTVDEAAALIKGPEGSKVSLEIDRGSESLSFDIRREKISLPAVKANLQGTDVGYIRLLTFSNGVAVQARLEIERLLTKGAEGIVLDMRDNGGGVFDEAIDVASLFIEDGPVVRYKQRGEDEIVYDAQGDAYEKVPVVVLVNGGTASASEIVAGALQDYGRAVLVGTTTFGKGSVQQLVPLPDGSAMKLTIAAYFTPKSGSIDGTGIDPDVEVSQRAEQKARAFQILRGLVLSQNSAG